MKFLDCEGMYPARQGSVKKKKKKKKKEAKKGPSRDRILSVAADEQKESVFWRLGRPSYVVLGTITTTFLYPPGLAGQNVSVVSFRLPLSQDTAQSRVNNRTDP